MAKFKKGEKKCLRFEIEAFYVLSKVNSPIIREFDVIVGKTAFWEGLLIGEDVYQLFYLAQMGFENNPSFKEDIEICIRDRQTIRGQVLGFDDVEHYQTGPMRVLVHLEPDSPNTKNAVDYFIQNLDRFIREGRSVYQFREIPIGLLALYDYDPDKYSIVIQKLHDFLTENITDKGYIELEKDKYDEYHNRLDSTSLALQALSRTLGVDNEILRRIKDWLREQQNQDGSWGKPEGYISSTSNAVLGLITAGEGPKISKEEWEQKEVAYQRLLKKNKAHVFTTNPLTSTLEIKSKIEEMIKGATNRLWIYSRYITQYWTDIISLKRDRPHVDIKIVTVPLKEKRNYRGNGKKFLGPAFDALQKTLGGNLKTTPLLHARCVISDDMILISSTDLTDEQLEREFNLGVLTRDSEAVLRTIQIFERFWSEIDRSGKN
ncbi:MAG: phospholipase D-like domain-containing protein [Candidatus Heimdallarchaeota archaeon]